MRLTTDHSGFNAINIIIFVGLDLSHFDDSAIFAPNDYIFSQVTLCCVLSRIFYVRIVDFFITIFMSYRFTPKCTLISSSPTCVS